MAKHNYAAVIQARMAQRDEEVRHHTRVYMMDMVTAALGRMGWGEKRFEKFDQVLTEVSADYAKLILEDSKDDSDLEYSKACLDRELSQYTGKRFVPYDERYR